MRIILQRAASGLVTVEGREVGSIGRGIVALVGIKRDDTMEDATKLARKLTGVRLWPSEDGKKQWARSVVACNYDLLLVSQFTLYAVMKGNKPDFQYEECVCVRGRGREREIACLRRPRLHSRPHTPRPPEHPTSHLPHPPASPAVPWAATMRARSSTNL